jgi:hypothetical protein
LNIVQLKLVIKNLHVFKYKLKSILHQFRGVLMEENKEKTEEKESVTKKIKKFLGIAAVLTLFGSGVWAGSILLTTVRSHFNVNEAFTAQYWDGQGWSDLEVNGSTIDLGAKNIKPGESDVTLIRINNTATGGTLGGVLAVAYAGSDLSFAMQCQPAGSGMKWNQTENTFYISVPSSTTYELGLNATVNPEAPVQSDLTFTDTFYRALPLGSYDNTCP